MRKIVSVAKGEGTQRGTHRRRRLIFSALASVALISIVGWALKTRMLSRSISSSTSSNIQIPETQKLSTPPIPGPSSNISALSSSSVVTRDASTLTEEERRNSEEESRRREGEELKSRIQEMRASGVAQCDIDAAVDTWQHGVPEPALRRGIAYSGDLLRLDRFLHKVVIGREAPTVLVLGGSATLKTAGAKGPQLGSLFGLGSFQKNPRVVGPTGWLSASLDRLTSSFPAKTPHSFANLQQKKTKGWGGVDAVNAHPIPGWTGDLHKPQPYWLLNLGLTNATPAAWAGCSASSFLEWLPMDTVDLVVFEFAVSEEEDFMELFDRMVQNVLARWPKTAVMFFNLFNFCRGTSICQAPFELSYDSIGLFSTEESALAPLGTLPESVGPVREDNVTVLAQYYSVPAVSVRNAFFHLLATQASGFGMFSVWERESLGFEPSTSQAQTLYADLIVFLFKTALQGMTERQEEMESEKDAVEIASRLFTVPHPFFQRWRPEDYVLDGTRLSDVRCFGFGFLDMPPEYRSSRGFELDVRRGEIPEVVLKSDESGSALEIVLDSRIPSRSLWSAKPGIGLASLLRVSFVVKATSAGVVVVECTEGCLCNPKMVDAFSPVPIEDVQSVLIPVTQAEVCVLKLHTVPKSAGVGTEFSLTGLAVLASPTIERHSKLAQSRL